MRKRPPPVIARAQDPEESGRLLEEGATQAFPAAIEASLRLGAEALLTVGVPADNVDMLEGDIRSWGYVPVREKPEGGPLSCKDAEDRTR